MTQIDKPLSSQINLSAASCENLSKKAAENSIVPLRKTVILKHSYDVLSDKDSGFGSFRSINNNLEENKVEKSEKSEKSVKPKDIHKRRERRKTVSIQLHQLPVHIFGK